MLEINFMCFIVIFFVRIQATMQKNQPHIILIMTDDMGWDDISFHGSNEIPTPNIDALAYSGLILNNYYVQPLCTPSRSALMTGKYPIHNGMQHYVIRAAEPRGLPLSERLLPEYLRSLGYATHLVGKWHLGFYKREYTPTERGFDTHLGYWSGFHDYFDHTSFEPPFWGVDLKRGLETAWDLHGKYSTDIFTDEAVRLIEAHNTSVPMFLFLSHVAPHTGNWYNPLPVPKNKLSRAEHVEDHERRQYATMMMEADDSVGVVIDSLNRRNMLENSVIVVATDNGGSVKGFNMSAGSNWPLRGMKNTLWEGGVRGAALLWSPKIAKPQRVANQLIHITDWLPTFYSLAGGDIRNLGKIDGFDLWDELSEDKKSKRHTVLLNIDDIYGTSAVIHNGWKLIKSKVYNGTENGWFGADTRGHSYNIQNVLDSLAGRAVASVGLGFTKESAKAMRKNAEINCESSQVYEESLQCNPIQDYCLYDVKKDPCEINNLADQYPHIKRSLEKLLIKFNSSAIPPSNILVDPRGDPKYWNYTWTTFGNFIEDSREMKTFSVAVTTSVTNLLFILTIMSILWSKYIIR